MIEKRKALDLDVQEMAQRCECSKALLYLLEDGDGEVTHPEIAARIAKQYGLTVAEYNQIVHESHHVDKLPKPKKRKNKGLYDSWRSGWGEKEET